MGQRAWILLWLLALIWGASYLFIKLGLEDLEPVFLVFVRLALGAAVLVALAASRGALAPLRGRLRAVVVLALLQVVIPFVLLTYGEDRIASSLTGILVAASPIFTAVLVTLGVGQEARIAPWALGGIGVGMAGVALLFGVDLTGSSSEALGGLMILGTALGYSLGALYLRRSLLGIPPLGVAAGSMTTATLMVLPVALFQLPDTLPSLKAAGSVVVLGVLGTGFAFWIFYTLIAEVGASRAAVVAYLAPGFAVGYGALFLNEPITAAAIVGLVLILAGSWLAAEGRAPWKRTVPVPEPVPVRT
ncbi:MAG: DMT family transporter [Solirubrobacteraceae bacterium]